jgi:hypothetical protein
VTVCKSGPRSLPLVSLTGYSMGTAGKDLHHPKPIMAATENLSYTHVFWRDGASHATDVVHPVTRRGLYSGLTVDELNEREGCAHQIVTCEQAAQLQQQADRAQYCTGAIEVTAERADEALNCLPPYRWSRCSTGDWGHWEAFAISEPLTDTLRTWLVRLGRRWFEITEDCAISYPELLSAVRSSPCFPQKTVTPSMG